MPDPLEVLSAERGRNAPAAFEGWAANDLESLDDELYVIIPAFDERHRFGPCPFLGGELPDRGDRCLVLFNEEREPWALFPNGGGG